MRELASIDSKKLQVYVHIFRLVVAMTLCLFYSHIQIRQMANEMRATYHLPQIER